MLKVLPENIYNLIAAGEVIKRPASVVKELMENSLDAGATSITLSLSDYGKTLIQVIDNGCGMTGEEASICFLSHSTSKIDKIEDLSALATFGFRGEALSSIAACADVTLKTRKEGEQTGTLLHIAASKQDGLEEIACPVGCNIAVKNIFYNIPARRRFLKSDNAEYKQITQEFNRVALTRLSTEFRLIHNSKEVIHLAAGRTLKQRISDLFGAATTGKIVRLGVETSVVKINGFICEPQEAKKSYANQYMFVNGRFFRNSYLYKAVIQGYSGLIQEGYSPSFFIYFEVKPEELDINISPDKSEVRFENESVIFQILEAAVKEAIGKNAFAPMIDFDTAGVPPVVANAEGFYMSSAEKENYRKEGFSAPKVSYNPLFNPFNEENLEEKPLYDILTIGNDFIAYSPKGGGVTIINVARAEARIFYEKYLSSLNRNQIARQEELFPTTVDLQPVDYEIIMANAELLKAIGFELRRFGDNCVVVCSTPADFKGDKLSIEEGIADLAHLLTENDVSEGLTAFTLKQKERLAIKVLRHANFKLKKPLSSAEANSLIERLLQCKEPAVCPLGGYCLTTITLDELIKRML